ncbi:hypothetical protein HPB50_021703 [Hyalomma asiaticum]|uniref:Uncharacterized protein n=1 Tax=Hyalomma asiaticum TaxID=266040 RepID=A0ACB7T8I1_HYAAI|nr:hypothetical protein HPB50_021703 [Hyalomma asiaticum]
MVRDRGIVLRTAFGNPIPAYAPAVAALLTPAQYVSGAEVTLKRWRDVLRAKPFAVRAIGVDGACRCAASPKRALLKCAYPMRVNTSRGRRRREGRRGGAALALQMTCLAAGGRHGWRRPGVSVLRSCALSVCIHQLEDVSGIRCLDVRNIGSPRNDEVDGWLPMPTKGSRLSLKERLEVEDKSWSCDASRHRLQ